MKFPFMNRREYWDTDINSNSRVINIHKTSKKEFMETCDFLKNEGFILKEENSRVVHSYKGYSREDVCVFINFFASTEEITIAIEKNCKYFSYSDVKGENIVSPQITQVHLEDFGMSYVIRVSDGRFIIIDGGRDLKPDAERIYDILKKGKNEEKPIIAAWIFTHAHIDHYRCFNEFTKIHLNDVVLEKVMYNFPFPENFLEEMPLHEAEIKDPEYNFENTSECNHMKLMYDNIKLYGAETYMPHTGQTYKIGDAVCEFLSCIDDTYYFAVDENSASLVFRMELGGQIILWTGDALLFDAKLLSKYGSYLKSDILQVPHHGFHSQKELIKYYEVINPDVCLIPISDYNGYIAFDIYMEATRYLMQDSSIKEIITGDFNRTLTLPYTAPEYARSEFKRKFEKGRRASGSEVWIYSGLNSSNKDDFVFTVFNATYFNANISIELFFDNSDARITGMSADIPFRAVKEINLRDKNSVEFNKCFFNWESVNKRGIPENTLFAVRFISEYPVVVTHKTHRPSYQA